MFRKREEKWRRLISGTKHGNSREQKIFMSRGRRQNRIDLLTASKIIPPCIENIYTRANIDKQYVCIYIHVHTYMYLYSYIRIMMYLMGCFGAISKLDEM